MLNTVRYRLIPFAIAHSDAPQRCCSSPVSMTLCIQGVKMEKWSKWEFVKVGFWLGIGFIIPQLVVLYLGRHRFNRSSDAIYAGIGIYP